MKRFTHILVLVGLLIAAFASTSSSKVSAQSSLTEDVTYAVSPDGNWVALVRSFESGPVKLVAVMHPDGSDFHRVGENAVSSSVQIIWSPDSKKIALNDYRVDQTVLTVIDTELDKTMDMVTFGYIQAFTPDSQHILWKQLRSKDGIDLPDITPMYISDLNWKNTQEYMRTQGIVSFSPNGKQVLFASDEQRSSMSVANVDDLTKTTRLSYTAFDGMWSPTGKQVLLAENSYAKGSIAGTLTLTVVNADGTHAKVLTKKAAYSSYSWSPDGKQIVFSQVSNLATKVINIYVINADGSGLKQITNGMLNTEPTFASGGKKIVFFSDCSGAKLLYSMNPDGTDLRLVYPNS